MEAGRQDSVESQTKLLSDHYKLARALKDQIDFIYKWLPGDQKQRITEVEVFGILSSGMSRFCVIQSCHVGCGVLKGFFLFHIRARGMCIRYGLALLRCIPFRRAVSVRVAAAI